jgi:putative transcriptional regulator
MKYKSEVYEVIHQDATANFEVGAISEAEMQEFNDMCLVQEPAASYSAAPIQETQKTAAMEHVTA